MNRPWDRFLIYLLDVSKSIGERTTAFRTIDRYFKKMTYVTFPIGMPIHLTLTMIVFIKLCKKGFQSLSHLLFDVWHFLDIQNELYNYNSRHSAI